MLDYYKKKSTENHEKARIAQENNQSYQHYLNEAQAYDKRITELESS